MVLSVARSGALILLMLIVVSGRPGLAQDANDAHAITVQALRAVEGDSVPNVAARWADQLRHDPANRAATLGLATIGWLTYDLPLGEQYYQRIIATNASDRFSVYARLGRARSLDSRSKYAEAMTEYDGALGTARAAKDAAAAGEILTDLSHTRYQTGGALAGLAALDTAKGLLLASDPISMATYHGRRAGFLMELRKPSAESEALTCIDLARRAHVLRNQGLCLNILAIDSYQRGNIDSAIVLMHAAIAAQGAAHNRGARGDALVTLGRMLVPVGSYGEARQAVYRGVADLRAAGQPLGWALYTVGEISRTIHDRPAAAAYAAESASQFDSTSDLPGMMAARLLQARITLDASDFNESRRLLQEHLAWAQRANQRTEEMDARLGLADVAERERDWAGAAQQFDSVRTLARRYRMTDWEGKLKYEYGLLALRRNDLNTAERDFNAYLHSLDSSETILHYRARARLAGIYAMRGDFVRAEKELSTAGEALDAWRATLADPNLRVLAFQATDDEDPDLGVPAVLAAIAVHGHAGRALELAERRRARALSDLLARGAALRIDSTSGGTRVLHASHPAFSISSKPHDAVVALDGNTALLEYVTGVRGASTTLFVATRARGITAHLLPPADSLEGSVGRLVALMEGGSDARVPARALGATLLGPAMADLPRGITGLVIVPDGPLHRVPFDALRLQDDHYAVEDYTIGIAPSAAVLESLRSRTSALGSTAASTARILVFGDVAFAGGRQSAEPGARRAHGSERSELNAPDEFPRLAGSATEAREVARYSSNATVRLREDASAAYLKRAPLDSFRVIHFATHAIVDDRSMASTVLALAPSASESGMVSPGDLGALHLDADLVVLSACRTAGGVVVTGEGVQGLINPLLQAGARSVVATQWGIGDQSTIAFIGAFYAALARRLTVAQALRAAKLDAIRRGAPTSEWAAFTLVGDPSVIVPLVPPRRSNWIALCAFAVALASVAIYFALRILKRRSEERASPVPVSARTHQE